MCDDLGLTVSLQEDEHSGKYPRAGSDRDQNKTF